MIHIAHNQSLHAQLTDGPDAFYNQANYIARTQADLAARKLLPVSYTWKTESQAWRIFKSVASIIIFPIGIYKLLHGLAGLAVLPGSPMSRIRRVREQMHSYRQVYIHPDNPRKYKRVTLQVDGYKIDTVFMVQPENMANRRWLVSAGGNAEFYEYQLAGDRVTRMGDALQANILVFNPPAVMCSSGLLPQRKAMEKAYRLMIHFLESPYVNAAGETVSLADEIILAGHSIGGGVVADTLLSKHKFNPQANHAAAFSRTFKDLSTAADTLILRGVGLIVKILGWNMNPARAARKTKMPHVVMQTGSNGRVIHDGIIAKEAAQATALQKKKRYNQGNIMLIAEDHNSPLQEETNAALCARIRRALQPPV